MSESRMDGDRVVLATTIILAVISVVMYFIVYLTLIQFQMLNDAGRTFAIVSMVISALAMLLACVFTSRGRMGRARCRLMVGGGLIPCLQKSTIGAWMISSSTKILAGRWVNCGTTC